MRLDRFYTIISVITYVESRVKEEINCQELSRLMGLSLPHLRTMFAETTGISLVRYITQRKVCNAAFDILHTEQSVTDIAAAYGFACCDTFTRAVKRVAGMTPAYLRRARPAIYRVKLCAGVYGIGLPEKSQREDESST